MRTLSTIVGTSDGVVVIDRQPTVDEILEEICRRLDDAEPEAVAEYERMLALWRQRRHVSWRE